MVGSTEAVDNNVGTLEVIPLEESVSTERKHVNYLLERRTSLRARYAYGFIFLLINLVAWFVRDYGHKFLYRLSYLKACGRDGKDCFYVEGVLRIFFLFMFFTTFRSSKLYESSNSWHSRWWASKFFILIILMVVPFFIPVDFIRLYGEVARIGAGIFLLLQLISVIHFITWWNNYWMPEAKLKKSCLLGLLMSTIFYIASVCGIVWMYLLYARNSSCSLNIFFITWTVILLLVMMLVSLHSKVNQGLLSSGIMGSYVVFLCWSAIRSEPVIEKCSPQNKMAGNGDWTAVISFLIAICAIVMATFSTGIDSESFKLMGGDLGRSIVFLVPKWDLIFLGQVLPVWIGSGILKFIRRFHLVSCAKFCKDEVQSQDDIPYKYGFFHIVFSLGAMYFAMLFISWNLDHSTKRWSIDVGWASTWVKIVNEWFAAAIYLWTLISPVIRRAKIMDAEEPVQNTQGSA